MVSEPPVNTNHFFPSILEKLTFSQANTLIDTDLGVQGLKDNHGTILNLTTDVLNALDAKQFKYRQDVFGLPECSLIRDQKNVSLFHKNDALTASMGNTYVIESGVWRGEKTYSLGKKQSVYDDSQAIVGTYVQTIAIGIDQILHFTNQLQQLSSHFSSTPLNKFEICADIEMGHLKITAKEMECLFYALRGKSAKETACYMSISSRTVEVHLAHLKNKFKAKSKMELISKAIEWGFFDKIPLSVFVTNLH